MGAIVAGWTVHLALLVLAPLNFLFLYRGYRAHGNRASFVTGGVGAAFLLSHMIGHLGLFDWLVGDTHITTDVDLMFPERWMLGMLPTWAGSVLLGVGSYLDIRSRWEVRATVLGCGSPEEYWRAVLTGRHGGLREGRDLLKAIPSPPRCSLCNAPFAGIGGPLMRAIGRGPSRLNPRFCASCLEKTPVGGSEIEVTLLFADLRGSTGLAETMSPVDFATLMDRFYRATTEILIDRGALVQGFIGDEVVGIFTPGFAGTDHSDQSITAAEEIVAATGHHDRDGPWVPIGIGVHTGSCFIGLMTAEKGRVNLGVNGDAPNVAARLASAARTGAILVSNAALSQSSFGSSAIEMQRLRLKGRTEEIEAAELGRGADVGVVAI